MGLILTSLYAQYVEEKEGKSVLETERGFISYFYSTENNVHIDIIYIKPEFRRNRDGAHLWFSLVEATPGAASYTAAVETMHNDPTSSLKFILRAGFEVVGTRGTEILLHGYKDKLVTEKE